MNELDELIKKLIKEKGGSRKDYLNLLNSIAYHESGHTLDPTIKQIGGGPGRGKYQFEVGKNAGAITAAKRTKQYYEKNNIPVPKWLSSAVESDSLDATNLTSEQQDVLFLGNMRQHPKADFSKVWNGEETVSDFWANYHWAGADKDRSTRLKSFNSSLDEYKKTIPDVTNEVKQVKPTFELNDERSQSIKKIDNTEVDIPKFKPTPLFDYTKNKQLNSNQNTAAYGGELGLSTYSDKDLNHFNGGGTHEQNPLGGIPIGKDSQGTQNTVEAEETSFELKRGKFIFSHRLKL